MLELLTKLAPHYSGYMHEGKTAIDNYIALLETEKPEKVDFEFLEKDMKYFYNVAENQLLTCNCGYYRVAEFLNWILYDIG